MDTKVSRVRVSSGPAGPLTGLAPSRVGWECGASPVALPDTVQEAAGLHP